MDLNGANGKSVSGLVRQRTSHASMLRFLDRLVEEPGVLDELSPAGFESFVAYLLTSLGYDVSLTPQARDRGRDLIATLQTPLSTLTVVIECKRYRAGRSVPADEVRRLLGFAELSKANLALLVTNSQFTNEAVLLADRQKVVQLIARHKIYQMASAALDKEQQRVDSVAFGLGSLPLKQVGRIEVPKTTEPRGLFLPAEFSDRIVKVDGVPLDLLRAINQDPRHLHGLTPRGFERFVAEVADGIGFNDVLLTPRSYDGGKDVIATKIVNGIPLAFYFECKQYAEGNKVQLDTLRAITRRDCP